ncbi:MAG: hypothetical protein V4651_03130 [Bacteroidota bacterium]
MKLIQYILLLIALQVVFVSTNDVSLACKSTAHYETVKAHSGDGGFASLAGYQSLNVEETEDDNGNLLFIFFTPFNTTTAFTATNTKRLYRLAIAIVQLHHASLNYHADKVKGINTFEIRFLHAVN